jgi:hypothetical protein
LRLLDDGRIIAGASPKSARQEQTMQVTQDSQGNPWSSQCHRGADAGVKHPRWQSCYDTCFDLDMDYASTGPLFAVVDPDATTMVGMPAVVNYNFLPDMGRMTA